MAGDMPLTELALKHGTDKYMPGVMTRTRDGHTMNLGGDLYAPHHDFHFTPFRHQDITILEIGIGGFTDPRAGGESLRMWKEYFPKAQIVGLDYYDKSAHEEDRIRIYRGSQDDPEILKRMSDECGGFDIIVDDGSHLCEHVIASFNILFPLLRTGGIYCVEDLRSSYWKVTGGSSIDLSTKLTSMGFFKSLVDGLNHVEFEIPGYKPTYLDKHITSITFYHNLVYIYKGEHDIRSAIMVDNKMPEQLAALYPTFDWMKK